MNEILINALAESVLNGNMQLEQVPIPFQELVGKIAKEVDEKWEHC